MKTLSCFLIWFEVLEVFKCLLGAFLGLPRLSWTAMVGLGPQNTETKYVCVVFQVQVFGTLKFLMDLLGQSWRLLR